MGTLSSDFWKIYYTSHFRLIPKSARDELCEDVIMMGSDDFEKSPMDTFIHLGSEIMNIEDDSTPDTYAVMGYLAAYVMGSYELAILVCQKYIEMREISDIRFVEWAFIKEDPLLKDALFDEWGEPKPYGTILNQLILNHKSKTNM